MYKYSCFPLDLVIVQLVIIRTEICNFKSHSCYGFCSVGEVRFHTQAYKCVSYSTLPHECNILYNVSLNKHKYCI